MNLKNVFDTQVNGVETDFRAEIVAAELIENDYAAERILIVPLGAMSRPQNKDIAAIIHERSEYDNKDYILIKTHKEGLYDKLPEGIFHGSISHVSNKTDKEIIAAIKQHRKEEKEARLFFLPFDAACNSLRVLIALYENQLDKKFHYNELVNVFADHWDIFKLLDPRQANVFLQVLPILHSVRDNWPAIEVILEQMFLVPAKLSIGVVTRANKTGAGNTTNRALATRLGEQALGVDFITGELSHEPGDETLYVSFGPLTTEALWRFTGSTAQEKVAQNLFDYLLPAGTDVAINYEILPQERGFKLSAETDETGCQMGISTYL